MFDAEVYVIYQELRLFDARSKAAHTVFSDPTAAPQADRTGPGQAFARAIIEVAEDSELADALPHCDGLQPTGE